MARQDGTFIDVGGNGTTELYSDQGRYFVRKSLSFEHEPEKKVVEAFRQECQILSSIYHPSLPRVLQHEVRGNNLSLLLEISKGESLADLMKTEVDPATKEAKASVFADAHLLRQWATELCDSVAFLHSQRPFPIIHRNLTPSTIWITDKSARIMLLDFGMLNSFHSSFTSDLASLKLTLGLFNHPDLMSSVWADTRADIYSLGRVFAFIVTGLASDLLTEDQRNSSLGRIAYRCAFGDGEAPYADVDSIYGDLLKTNEENSTTLVTCAICGHLNKARSKFCRECNELLRLRPSTSEEPPISKSLLAYEDQAESKIVASYRKNRFASLSHYRMMELLDEVEADPGFEELLSLPNLPDVAKMQHQKTAVLRALQRMRGRALLADEVGLGKTVEAGIFLKELLLRGLVEKVLIVCPSTTLAAQWQSELYDKFGEIALVFGHDIDSSLAWHCSRLITTYDTLRQPFHVEELLRHTYHLLILDEAHFLNDPDNSVVLETVKNIQKKYFLMLSATPMHKSLRELYNIVTLLRPGHFADLASFEREFIDSEDEMQAKNVETLRELLQQIMIRNRRQDITDYDFPKRRASLHSLPLHPDAMAFYESFRNFLKAATANVSNTAVLRHVGDLAERICSSPDAFTGQINRLKRNWKVRQVLGDGGLRKLEHYAVTYPESIVQPKLEATISILKQLAKGGVRALAFSEFDETARYFHRRLQGTELGPFSFLYDAQSTLGARQAAVKKLEETPGGILVCPGEASEGLNLQFASLMINLDLPWNPMKLEQRIGRVQRIGGKKDVLIFNLVLQGTIEEKIYEICSQRIKMFETIVGHVEEILGNLREEEDIQTLIRNFYLDREAITDDGEQLSAEANLDRALDEAEDKSSQRSEESLSYIYGASHFDPSSAEDDEDY